MANYLQRSGTAVSFGVLNASDVLAGTLGPAQGGTGITSFALGDVIYASGATALSRLPIGSSGQVLTASSGTPSWASPTAANNQTAAYASLTSTLDGQLGFPSDGASIYRGNGSALVPWGPIFPFTAPVDGDFSWVNQGSASVTTTHGGIHLAIPGSATVNLRVRKKAAPTTPYTITAAFLPCFIAPTGSVSGGRGGLIWRQSSDGKIVSCWLEYNQTATSSGVTLSVAKWTSATAFSANYQFRAFCGTVSPVWLQIKDDGSNRVCCVSSDGQNWLQFHSVARTDFMTADEVGFALDGGSSNIGQGLTLLHWKQT